MASLPSRQLMALSEPGLIIDARMQHARIVAGLMMGDLGFFFEHDHPLAGILPRELPGRRQADDSAADDRHIRTMFGHVLPVISKHVLTRNGRFCGRERRRLCARRRRDSRRGIGRSLPWHSGAGLVQASQRVRPVSSRMFASPPHEPVIRRLLKITPTDMNSTASKKTPAARSQVVVMVDSVLVWETVLQMPGWVFRRTPSPSRTINSAATWCSFCPIISLLRSQDHQRSRISIGERAVLRDDRSRGQPMIDRPAGAGIDRVAILFAVDHHEVAIIARSRQRLPRQFDGMLHAPRKRASGFQCRSASGFPSGFVPWVRTSPPISTM